MIKGIGQLKITRSHKNPPSDTADRTQRQLQKGKISYERSTPDGEMYSYSYALTTSVGYTWECRIGVAV